MVRLLSLALFVSVLGLASRASAVGSCGQDGVLGERQSVEFQGSLYYVTTPPGYSADTPWPVIFGLHGDEGDPADSVNFFWREVPDGSFIFVAPKAPNPSGSWYEEQESNEQWLDELLASVLAQYNVDLDRVYIWGLSGGAVFTSRYILARQHVFAAAEMNMGGSGRRYVAPAEAGCEIPARFVVSLDDFLRDSALSFFELLTDNGHETDWVDADCSGHCFDREQAGPVARDWLLTHTLCGATPTLGCEDDPVTPPEDEPVGAGGALGQDPTPNPVPSGGSGGQLNPTVDPSTPIAGSDGLTVPMYGGANDVDAGCGCRASSSKTPANAWIVLLGLLAVRRRR